MAKFLSSKLFSDTVVAISYIYICDKIVSREIKYNLLYTIDKNFSIVSVFLSDSAIQIYLPLTQFLSRFRRVYKQ